MWIISTEETRNQSFPEPKNVLSERSQPQKIIHILRDFYLYEISRRGKSRETESKLVVVLHGGKMGRLGVSSGEWQVIVNGYRISFWTDENILKLIVVMGCTIP